jgi:uncharacterized protein
MSSQSEVIETTVSKVAAELVRRGLDPDDRVTIMIELDELIPGRRASRARVVAAGLTDVDIDRLIKQAQKEVEPRAGWGSFSTRTSWSARRLNNNPCRGWRCSWSSAAAGLLKSLATEQQLFEVVARPRLASLIDPETQAWLKKLMAAAELATITDHIAACRDPTDDKFLELAVNGHADLIVSGDGDLLALNPFRDIPIVTPAAFVQGVVR